MSKFRKKPVVIEAVRWAGDIDELVEGFGRSLKVDLHVYERVDGGLEIATLEGTMLASRGDWIIRGIKGEFYPCKPDIFAATYEPVKE